MPSAEIIAIGTELLLGDIQDTNTRYLARLLRDLGIDLFRTMMIGDNVERIAQAVREASLHADIVITTGGLGPTVDDPTRQAVALAFGVESEFRPELWDQIQNRFMRMGREASENNRRQAYIPQGALAVENPVGTAPAFILEVDSNRSIISIPGVPREMEYLMEHAVVPYLRRRYTLSATIQSLVLHTAGVGESTVDELVGDLETNANPTVGLLAHPGQIDIRITAKAGSIEEAAQMTALFAERIRARLGQHIYGQDDETLTQVTMNSLAKTGWSMGAVESGLNGLLLHHLGQAGLPADALQSAANILPGADLGSRARSLKSATGVDLVLAADLADAGDRRTLTILILTPVKEFELTRAHSGPLPLSPQWAVNTALDFLRRSLIDLAN